MSSEESWLTGSESLAHLALMDLPHKDPEFIEVPRPSFVPDTIPYKLRPEDLSLIRIQFKISFNYELELPGPNDRACSPPPG